MSKLNPKSVQENRGTSSNGWNKKKNEETIGKKYKKPKAGSLKDK